MVLTGMIARTSFLVQQNTRNKSLVVALGRTVDLSLGDDTDVAVVIDAIREPGNLSAVSLRPLRI